MKLVVGADHKGVCLKTIIAQRFYGLGHEVYDVGTHHEGPVDYPDYAEAVGRAIQQGRSDRGVLLCGSGVGAAIAVNKMTGVRGGLCHDVFSARQGVAHDGMNVLVLGARVTDTELALDLVRTFVEAEFDGAERHLRRLNKVAMLEHRGRIPHRNTGYA